MFETLGRISEGNDGERLPQWLSTHPDPGNRIENAQARIRSTALPSSGLRVGRNSYLGRLDGLTFGADPRQGYFKEEKFYHPELKFRLDFPKGWKTRNGVNAVVAISPKENAAVELALAGDRPPSEAASEFLSQEDMIAGRTSTDKINGLAAATALFETPSSRGRITGRVAFIALGDNTYRILGYGNDEGEPRHRDTMWAALTSFKRLTDRAALSIKAATLNLVTLDRAMTVEEFHRRYPSTIPVETVALINGRSPGDRLAAGEKLKRITGGELP